MAETRYARQCVLATTRGQVIRECGVTRTNINMSDVYTRLIQSAGRFAESYASDLLYDIGAVEDLISRPPDPDDFNGAESLDYYMAAGIRESGVDGNDFLMDHLRKSVSPPFGYTDVRSRYRKVLCVHVKFTPAAVEVSLDNVTDHLGTLAESDKTPEASQANQARQEGSESA